MPTPSLPHPFRTTLMIAVIALLAIPAAASAAAPAITIGPVDCGAGGSVVTATLASGAPVRLRVLNDGKLVGTMIVPAGTPVTRVVPIAEGAASRIDVRHVDVYTSAFVRRDCSGARPAAAATAAMNPTSPDSAPYGASPVIPATGVRAADQPPAAPTPTTNVPAAEASIENRTWALLSLAAIALLAAGGVAISSRRGASRARNVKAPTS